MSQNGLFAQNPVLGKTVDGAHTIAVPAVLHVGMPLADVDVVAGETVVRGDHVFKGAVRDGKERVTAEHGLEHIVLMLVAEAGEVGILAYALVALALAVALRDLIAEAGAYAEALCLLGDGKEAAGDLAIACVVVEDGRHAVAQRFHDGDDGAGVCSLHVKVAVDVPPHSVQHLIEGVGIVATDGQTASQPRVDVGVRVDETGHDDAAVGVEILRLRVQGAKLRRAAEGAYRSAVAEDGAVGQIGHGRVAGENFSVSDDEHITPP